MQEDAALFVQGDVGESTGNDAAPGERAGLVMMDIACPGATCRPASCGA